ncbi:MAG: hypothetical protein J1F01_02520 [Oscillospiraceae bacterium]|nr:hypothetical protein [Oscillospiraceae bacterium]
MDCHKLITKNLKYSHRARIDGDTIIIPIENNLLHHSQIQKIISTLSITLFKKKIQNIKFVSHDIGFGDKLTYILFECLVYALIKNYKKNVYFLFNKYTKNITAAGIEQSLLWKRITNDITDQGLVEQFDKRHINLEHFRQIVKNDPLLTSPSTLITDVQFFLNSAITRVEKLQQAKLDREYISKVSEIVSELASNASEHAKADCLVDIDVSAEWRRADNDKSVVAINLVVLDFSQTLLGDNLCRKIENFDALNLSDAILDRYETVKKAYRYHATHFDSNYTKEDFFNIASFQNQISSRIDKATGGTGLPKLLRILLEQTDLDICYLISGDRMLRFTLDNLQFAGDWVGFNKSHDFISDIPDKNSISHSSLFLPGCAYNLNLVIKPEEA